MGALVVYPEQGTRAWDDLKEQHRLQMIFSAMREEGVSLMPGGPRLERAVGDISMLLDEYCCIKLDNSSSVLTFLTNSSIS